MVSVFIRGAFAEGLSGVYGELKSVGAVGDRWSLFFLVCVAYIKRGVGVVRN